MKNIFNLFSISLIGLLFLGCGSVTTSQSDVTVNATKSTLGEGNKNLSIDLLLTNNYASTVEVELKDLLLNVSPCVIEHSSLNPSSVSFETQRNITLTAELLFKDSCIPKSYTLEGTSVLTLDEKTREIPFYSSREEINATEFINNSIENNESSIDTNSSETNTDTINYSIDFSLDKESPMKFALNDKRSFFLKLLDQEFKSVVPSERIIKMEIKSKQPNIVKVFDANAQTTPTNVLSYEKENDLVIYMKTFTRSGLADIDVKIDYLNSQGKREHIEKTYAVLVMSGPPTAFSINSAGVSYNSETKWFEHKYMISGVDRYNNIVNISPTIYVSAISGLARDKSGKELLYGKFGEVKGTLNPEDGTFKATKSVFDNIDLNRDSLFVFGDVTQYEALGKWDIDPYSDSADTLKLAEVFNGKTQSNLGFMVGHNYLDDISSSSNKEWQVKIDSSDGKYQLDEEGKAFVTLKYPPYFIGKRIAFAVNFLGKTPETDTILRSGEVEIMTARNLNGVKSPEAITIEANGTIPPQTVFFEIDTGTEDRFFVRNSQVRCDIEAKNIKWNVLSENKISSTVQEYIANGSNDAAYWALDLELIDLSKSGTFTFKECNVASLPSF